MARKYSTKDGCHCQSSTPRAFNIPKLNKTKNSGTLDYVSRADRVSQELMDDVDRLCFFSATEYQKQWRVAAVRMVRPTSYVEEQYRQKRSDLKKHHGGHLPQEVLGFYICKDKNQAKKIARYGIRTGSSHNSSLGNPDQGVYLYRYVDVALLSQMDRKVAYVFVFKVNLGRTKKLPLSDSSRGCSIEPSPLYDAHISHRPPQNDDSTSILCRRSQMYLYEYTDDAVPSQYPRQCLPFAFLEFIPRSNESRSGDTQVCSEKASTSAAHQYGSTFSEQDDTNVNEVNLNIVYKEQGISEFVRKSTSSSDIGDEPTNHETCQVEMTNKLSLCDAEKGKVVSGSSERRPAFGNQKDVCSSDAQSMFQKTVQETEKKQSIPDSLGLMSKPVADVRKSVCSTSGFKLGTAADEDDCDLSKQNPIRGTSESRQNIAESGQSLFPTFLNFQDPRFYEVYGPSNFHLAPRKNEESFSPIAEKVDEDPRLREPEVSCAHSDFEENQSVSEQCVDPDKTVQEEYFTFSRDPRLRQQKKTISSTLQSKTSKEHAEIHSQPHQFQSTSAANVMTVINKLLGGKSNLGSQQVQRDPMESWGLTWNENFDVSDHNESTESFQSQGHTSDLTKCVQGDARNSTHTEPKSADRRLRMKDTVSSSHVLPMKDHSATYQSESSQRREQPPSPLPPLLCMSSPQAAQLNAEGLVSSVGSENPRVQATTFSSSMSSETNSTAAASQDCQPSRLDVLRSFTQHAVHHLGLPAPQDNQLAPQHNQSAPQDNQPSRLDVLRSFTQLAIQNVGLSAHPTKNMENTSDANEHDIQSGQKSTFKSVTPEIPGSTASWPLKVPFVPQTASRKVIGDHQDLDFQSGQETISKSHTHVISCHATWQPSKTSALETALGKSKDGHQHYGVNRVADFSSQHTQSANKISPPRLPNQVRLSSQQTSHPAETVCQHPNEILKSVEQKTNKVHSVSPFVPPLASIEGDDCGEMYESILLALKDSETEEGDKPPDDGFQGVLSTSGTSNNSEQNSEAECTQLTGRDSAMVTGGHVSSTRREESSQQESAQGMADTTDSPVVADVRLNIDGQQEDSSACDHENTHHQKHEQIAAARSVETSQQSLFAVASVPMDTVSQNQECCNMDCSEPELTESTEQEQNLCMNGSGSGKPQLDHVVINFSCTIIQPDAVSDNQTKSTSQHLLSCHIPTEEQKDSMIDNDRNTALLPTDATDFSKELMQQEAASTSENAENPLHVSAEEEHHSVDESDQTTPVLPDTDRELDRMDENDQNTVSLPGTGGEQNKNQEQQNTIAEISQHTLSQSTSQNKQQDCMDENDKSSLALSHADTNLNKNPEQQGTVPESQESIPPDNSESQPGSENHSSTACFLLPETELSASSPDSISGNEKLEGLSIACAVNMSAAEIDTNSSLIQQPGELNARQSMAADHKAEASTSRPQSQKLKEKETDLSKPQDWPVNQGEETDGVTNMDTSPDQTSNGVRASQPEDMAAAAHAQSKDLVTTPPSRETASFGRALPLSSLGLNHWMEALFEPKLNPQLTLVDICEAYLGKADFDNCVICQKVITFDRSEEQETMEASQCSTELASSAMLPFSDSEQVRPESTKSLMEKKANTPVAIQSDTVKRPSADDFGEVEEDEKENQPQLSRSVQNSSCMDGTSFKSPQKGKDEVIEIVVNFEVSSSLVAAAETEMGTSIVSQITLKDKNHTLNDKLIEQSLKDDPAEFSMNDTASEDSLQNSSEEDSLQNSSSEDSLQNSSAEDSLQNSSAEDNLQNYSAEDSLQNSSAEDSLQNSSEEDSLQNSSAEDSLQNSSAEDSLQNYSAEDSLQNSPTEDSQQNSPAEDSLQNLPAEDSLQNSSAEDSQQNSSAEDSLQNSPAEDSLQNSPAEESLQNLPAEESLKNLPAEDSQQNSPAEDSLKNLPAEDSLKNLPAEDSLQNLPAEESLKNLPAEDSLKNSSAEDSQQNSPAEDSLKNLPAEDSLKNLPAEDSLKNLPAEDSQQNSPAEDSLKNLPAEDSLKNLPAEDSLKNLSAEDSLKNLPAEDSLKKLPAEDSLKNLPAEDSLKNLPAEDSLKNLPAEDSLKNLPAEDSLKNLPAEDSLKNLPAEDSLKKLPAEDSLKNLPAEESLKNLSAEDSLKNLPAEDSLKKLPAEDSLKNLPAEDSLKNLPAEDSIHDQSQYTSGDQLELSLKGYSAEYASKDQSAEAMTKEHSTEGSHEQQPTCSSLNSWSLQVAEKEDASIRSLSEQKQKSGRASTGFFSSKRRYGISNSFSTSFSRNILPRNLATSSPSGSPRKSVQFCKRKLLANKEENFSLSEMQNDSEKETETGSPVPTLAMRKDARQRHMNTREKEAKSFFSGHPLYHSSLPVEPMFSQDSAEGKMQCESSYHVHYYQHAYQKHSQMSASECAERGNSLQQSGKKDLADYFQDIIGEKRKVASDTMPKMESKRVRIKHDFSATDNYDAKWEQRGFVSSKAERSFHGRRHEQKRKSGSGETKWKNDQESASSAKKQKLSTDRKRNGCTSTDSSEMNDISQVQQRSADIERKLHTSGHVLDKTQTTHRAVPSKTDIHGGHDTTSKASENVSPGGKSETKMSTLGRGKKISDMPWLFSVHRLSPKLSRSDQSGQRSGDKRPLLSKTDESIVDSTRKRRKDEGYNKDDISYEIRGLKLESDRHHAKLRGECAVSPVMNSTEDYANRRHHTHSSQHDRVMEYSSHGVQKEVCTFSCRETDRCSVSFHSSSPAVVKDPEMLENAGSLSRSQENTMNETSWSYRTEVHQKGGAEKCSTELFQEPHAGEQDLGSASCTVHSHQHVNSDSDGNGLLRTSACSSRVPDLASDAWFSNCASHNTQGPDAAQSREQLSCCTSQASLAVDFSASLPTPVDTNRNDSHIGSTSYSSLSSWSEESFTEEQMKLELRILDDCLRLVEVICKVDRQADPTLGSLPVTNLSDPDLKTLRKSLKGVLKDYKRAVDCMKRDPKGKPHQRIPQELLFSDEINQLYTREGVFVVLISSIPMKSYSELLKIKAAIEDAIKRGYTKHQSKMPDQIAEIQQRRKILMENHTGKVSIKLLNQLQKQLSFYTVCQDHMRRVLGHETVEKLVVFRSSFKAVERHLGIVQREMRVTE